MSQYFQTSSGSGACSMCGDPDVCLEVTLTALAAGRGLVELEGKTCAALGLSAETFQS